LTFDEKFNKKTRYFFSHFSNNPKNISMRNLFIGIINGILVAAVLFMGLPCFIAGDLNQDRKVDLADAIVGVRDLARNAEETVLFGEKMKSAVVAVQAAAGLKTRVVPDNDAGFFKSLDNHFLISTENTIAFSINSFQLPEAGKIELLINHLPPTPPPRIG
jgi:hypothetical protein